MASILSRGRWVKMMGRLCVSCYQWRKGSYKIHISISLCQQRLDVALSIGRITFIQKAAVLSFSVYYYTGRKLLPRWHRIYDQLASIYLYNESVLNCPYMFAVLSFTHTRTNIHIYYRQKYGISENHNGNTCIWHFDLLEMAWHHPQSSIVTLMKLSYVVLCA